ncbi:MAG TPA: hypothetical protein VH500_00520 [Nitrososphaeraceae archaeon]|jgi:hypothetical protein
MKSVYVIQPYAVGSKTSKSLAIIIPAEVKKEFHIDISTPFVLYPDKATKIVTLQNMKEIIHTRNMMYAGQSLAASNQHTSETK